VETTGNRFVVGPGDVAITDTRNFDLPAWPSLLGTRNLLGRSGTELWFSFLGRREIRTAGSPTAVVFGVALTDGGGSEFFIGQVGSQLNWGLAENVFGAQLPSEFTISGTPVVDGATVSFVARLRFADGTDTADLWLNPAPGQPLGPAQATHTVLGGSGIEFNRIELVRDGCRGSWDEIRLGTTLAAVLPPTNPPVEPPVLRTDALRFAGGKVSLEVETVPGASYTLQFKNDLSEPEWRDLVTVIGDGGRKTLEDAAATEPARFYRVRVAGP
jgi:hypothetical protein